MLAAVNTLQVLVAVDVNVAPAPVAFFAVVSIGVVGLYLCFAVPDLPALANARFVWKAVNYTPLLVGGVLILLYIYWHVSVTKWFTGPIRQVDETGQQLEGVS